METQNKLKKIGTRYEPPPRTADDHTNMEEVKVQVAEHHHEVIPTLTTWQSCCLRTDRVAVIFLTQMCFSFIVLGFSGYMLAYSEYNCERSSPYLSLISFILGKLLTEVVK